MRKWQSILSWGLSALSLSIIAGLGQPARAQDAPHDKRPELLPSEWRRIEGGSFHIGGGKDKAVYIKRYYRENYNAHSYDIYVFYTEEKKSDNIITFEAPADGYNDFIVRSGVDCLVNEFALKNKDGMTQILRIRNNIGEAKTTVDIMDLEYNTEGLPGTPELSFETKYTAKIPRICRFKEIFR